LQVRAWNKADESIHESFPRDVAADIAAAQLFGFFMNLRLRETARAIALSVQVRTAIRRHESTTAAVSARNDAIRRSDDELRPHMARAPGQGVDIGAVVDLNTDFGSIQVAIATPTLNFARQLYKAQTWDECRSAMIEADHSLDQWVIDKKAHSDQRGTLVLSLGTEITFPREVWGRP
jgi:hypothetical protein